jgi:hypothetical protein
MKHFLISLLVVVNLSGLDCSGSRKGCSPCYGGRKSPELNRDYYLPPSRITWRQLSQEEEELKENDLKARGSFEVRGIERLEGEREPYPYRRVMVGDGGAPYRPVGYIYRELPKRRRSSSATTTLSDSGSDSSDGQDMDRPQTICDRLRNSIAGICTQSQSKWVWTIPTSPLKRQGSFVDSEQPGLMQRTTVVDTRRRTVPLTKSSRVAK